MPWWEFNRGSRAIHVERRGEVVWILPRAHYESLAVDVTDMGIYMSAPFREKSHGLPNRVHPAVYDVCG